MQKQIDSMDFPFVSIMTKHEFLRIETPAHCVKGLVKKGSLVATLASLRRVMIPRTLGICAKGS